MEHKQIVITEFGDANVLAIQHASTPSPQPGEVLVKVAFSGVNPIDVKTRAGLGWAAAQNKDNLPWVPGYDISGKVVSSGEGGRRVLMMVMRWLDLSVSQSEAVVQSVRMCSRS